LYPLTLPINLAKNFSPQTSKFFKKMTSYENKGPRPEVGKYHGFDHITFW